MTGGQRPPSLRYALEQALDLVDELLAAALNKEFVYQPRYDETLNLLREFLSELDDLGLG